MDAPTVETQVGMPMEDFIRLYDKAPFELIDGERIEIMPNLAGHSSVLENLHETLVLYKHTTQGVFIHTQSPYVLTYSSNWVKGSRVPDIMVYRADRMAVYQAQDPDWAAKPFVLVPDVCIEIVSPNDTDTEIEEKIERYLADGVRAIWVINPQVKITMLYQAGSNQVKRLTVSDTLDGGEVLPGFTLPLATLFGV